MLIIIHDQTGLGRLPSVKFFLYLAYLGVLVHPRVLLALRNVLAGCSRFGHARAHRPVCRLALERLPLIYRVVRKLVKH